MTNEELKAAAERADTYPPGNGSSFFAGVNCTGMAVNSAFKASYYAGRLG